MAHGPDWKNSTIKAHTLDVDIGPYIAVVVGVADDSVKLPTGTGVKIRGITLETGKAGEVHPVGIEGGIYEATAGAAFAVEADLMVADATGKLITATSTNTIVAKALEAATASGDVVKVQIKPSTVMA